jgi:uncharacterized cupredoxin-like copper-binding protein
MDVLVSKRRRAGAAMTMTAVSLFVIACSGPAATTPAPTAATTQAAATPAGSAAGQATTVDVTLQEWSLAPSATSIAAGSVTFNAKNVGPAEQHEMVVVKTDLGLLELPTGSDGKVDEEGANLEAMGEVTELNVGASGSVTLDLTAGHYLLICNIVDADGTAHYGKGMVTALTVN